jgi:uncharacterized membrane protein HdeD (DUF308 family)
MLGKRWTSGPIMHLTRGAAPVEPPAGPSSLAGRLAQRVIGAALIIVGLFALAAPYAIGTWSLQFLALPMSAVGAVDLYTTISSRERRAHASSYATACLAIAGALLLLVSPSLVATSVVAILILLLSSLVTAHRVGSSSSTASRTCSWRWLDGGYGERSVWKSLLASR